MTTVSRPDFIDSPYFVPEPDNWHLKPGAPREVIREFNKFMRETRNPFIKLPEEEKHITLHEAITRVVNTYGPNTSREIAKIINNKNVYKRNDGQDILANQISARVNRYPHLFINENGVIHLNKKNMILYVEASVGGCFGSSYNAVIDLEKKIAKYTTTENGYDVIGDVEIALDDITIERLQLEITAIRIQNWEKEYFLPILDGTNWSVKVITAGGICESCGSNDFPKDWSKFCKIIISLFKAPFR